MAEIMIHRNEADRLRRALKEVVDELEQDGFERQHIGAAMVGVGAGIVKARQGRAWSLQVIDSVKDAMMAEEAN